MSYRYIDDIAIADIAFEAQGKTLEEMFKSSALAVEEIMVDFDTLNTSKNVNIELESDSIENLLHDFLEELVFLKDADQLIFKEFDIKIENNKTYKLKCRAHGDTLDYSKQTLKLDVKAITRHMFEIKKENDIWKCFVIPDI